jgi:hypothetical protein
MKKKKRIMEMYTDLDRCYLQTNDQTDLYIRGYTATEGWMDVKMDTHKNTQTGGYAISPSCYKELVT